MFGSVRAAQWHKVAVSVTVVCVSQQIIV